MYLLTTKPNWFMPVFQQVGNVVQFKRFPADYMWRDFLDLSGLAFDDTDINAAIAALEATDVDQYALLDGVAADIIDLQNRATDVEAAAVAAQNDATTSLANDAALDTRIDALESFAGGTFFPDSAYIVPSQFAGGRWGTPSLQSGQWLHMYWTISGVGTVEEIKVPLSAGNYNISIGYIKTAGSGRIAIKLDGTLFPSTRLDFYNSTTQLAQYSDVLLKNSVSAGVHTLRLEMDGKNASSSGFAWLISFISIRQV